MDLSTPHVGVKLVISHWHYAIIANYASCVLGVEDKGRSMEKEVGTILKELPISLFLIPSLMCYEDSLLEDFERQMEAYLELIKVNPLDYFEVLDLLSTVGLTPTVVGSFLARMKFEHNTLPPPVRFTLSSPIGSWWKCAHAIFKRDFIVSNLFPAINQGFSEYFEAINQ
ncbi:hypothetical protein M9H77_02452 [Catharanthus roseus]|uniref:Uncharacterized protein n=1 Tax=Catharanthus roseus TaxID=4058 RepID=A0ACC0C8J2_CATRO|nr:hypothetical protein M9H77_02452 [Catharanthus roseus]